ncbi:MAG: hypothetical protein MIO93_10295 [ANME-2 cluster archaeon]|nr:hypothetical protein [ANME-2 cluster archaeon]
MSIVIIPSSASVILDENVWVIQESGNIEKGASIKFDHYSIKVHEFHEDRVLLAVYKDDNFLELFEYYEDEWRQYENLRINVHKIENSKALISISKQELRRVWEELETAHALWGDYIQRDKYGIDVASFNNNSVNIIVYENSDQVNEEIYSAGKENEISNDFKIFVPNVDGNGYVDIRFFKKLPLSITGTIETDNDVYRPGEQIICQVEFLNSGNMAINLAEVELRTEPEMNIINSTHTINDIAPNQSSTFEFIMVPSANNEDYNIKITANVNLTDYFGKTSGHSFFRNIYISSSAGIIKEVEPTELEFQDDSRKADNIARVQLTVFNVGDSNKELIINDNIPDHIRLYNSTSMEWNKTIPPGENVNINYYIIPDLPGKYSLPQAEINFNNESIYSAGVSFIVHGPIISIDKKAEIRDDIVYISNYIQNTGDRPANVTVHDNLPQDTTIIEGSDFLTDVMQVGESGELNYSIQYYEGMKTLPGADIEYQDITGNTWSFRSDPVDLGTNVDTEITKVDLITFLLSFYLVILSLCAGIIILIGAIIYSKSVKND